MSTLSQSFSNFRFLVRGVRWVELVLAAAIVFFTRAVADLQFDWRPVLGVFVLGFIWNWAFWFAGRKYLLQERGLAGARLLVWSWVVADIVLNLLLIMFTGLMSSPFLFFLVFPVILSTVALGRPRSCYGVALGSSFGMAALWAMDRAGSIPHFPAYEAHTDAAFMQPNVAAATFVISATALCSLVYTIFRFRPNFYVFQEGYREGQFRISSLRPGALKELKLEEVENVGPEELLEEIVQALTLCDDIVFGAAVILPAGSDTLGGEPGSAWHAGLNVHRVVSTARRQVLPTWSELKVSDSKLFGQLRHAQTGDLFEGPFSVLQEDGLFLRVQEADSYLATTISQNGRAVVVLIAGLRHPLASRSDVLVHLLGLSAQLKPLLVAESRLSEMRGEISELHNRNEALSRTNKLQSDFVSIASHELKTPLTAIRAYMDALLTNVDRPDFPERHEFLQVVQHEADRLLRMVNRILDFSQIEFGHRALQRRRIVLKHLVDEVYSTMRPQLEERAQKLTIKIAESLPRVDVDPDLMKQVLLNLIGNAVKFSPKGTEIALQAQERASTIDVSVQDRGPGIPDHEIEHIFKQFYRVRSEGQAVEGSGLGLTIVRNIIELHGGRVEVDGGFGRGATFRFSIPKEQLVNEHRETVLGDLTRRAEFQQMMRLLVRMVADYMGCKIVSVMLLSADRQELFIQMAYGLDESVVRSSRGRVGEGIAGRVAATGRALLIENVADLEGRTEPNHPQYETTSLLSVPLLMDGQVIGVVNCNNKLNGQVFQPDDLTLLMTLTEKITVALSRALRYEDMRNDLAQTVRALEAMVKMHDSANAPDRQSVRYAMEIGRRVGLGRQQILALQYACVVHDVGMVKVDWDVINKRGPLTASEKDVIRRHPIEGAELIEPFLDIDELDHAIRHHHERIDGSGYPDGISGEHIPLQARILSVVDAFDSMTRGRPYRAAVEPVAAMREILQHVGTQFDGQIVEVLLELLKESGSISRQEYEQIKESESCLRPVS